MKIIAGLSTVAKFLTFHMARHTFSTTVTLVSGVLIASISKMSGHPKIIKAMIYAKVNQRKVEIAMIDLQNKMNDKKTARAKALYNTLEYATLLRVRKENSVLGNLWS